MQEQTLSDTIYMGMSLYIMLSSQDCVRDGSAQFDD